MNVWLAPLISAISAILSLAAVVIVARMNWRDEHRKWLREERVRSTLELKLAVSRVRVRFSRLDKGPKALEIAGDSFDFSDINSAMARIELTGSAAAVEIVATLRRELREFVRLGVERSSEWRTQRELLDSTVDLLVETVRRDMI